MIPMAQCERRPWALDALVRKQVGGSVSFHKIISLEIDDGFLKGTKIDFADHLTCVIGSRGSGKTTILEFLRYALNESIPPQVKRLIDKNLKPGRLQLVVEDAEGRRFVIERLCNEPPKVFEGSP